MNPKIKVILTFLTLFALGFASGYLFKGAFYPSSEKAASEYQEINRSFRDMQRQGRPEPDFDRARANLSRWMRLNDDQQEAFFEALSQFRSDVRGISAESRESEQERILTEYHEFRYTVEKFLNEEQLHRLDSRLHPDSVRTNRQEAFRRSRGQ